MVSFKRNTINKNIYYRIKNLIAYKKNFDKNNNKFNFECIKTRAGLERCKTYTDYY